MKFTPAPRRGFGAPSSLSIQQLLLLGLVALSTPVAASIGDRLPEFQECVRVCERENCGPDAEHQTPIPLHRRLLLWTCPQECDYTCQHLITSSRLQQVQQSPPGSPAPIPHPDRPIVQYHGKWPFHRFLGAQEPFSVLFSLGNFYAHYDGLYNKILPSIPASYPLRKWYIWLAYVGMASWFFSAVFHTRDLAVTEQLDYFAAGASVLYGLYYSVVRIFRLDKKDTSRRQSLLRLWTALCILMYVGHVAYLKMWTWDYTYNMAANVAVGAVQNVLWSWYSWTRYRSHRKGWAAWPGIVVAWVMVAMSLELLDFPPLWGAVDAHSLWHAGTIIPAVIWYNFLVRDAQDDMARSERLKS
ncbi:Per1-like-domain-containing protein [Pseudoneurospora amorphoporcata]|uniref:Post-GPI attachment to proteins factor 3 n=1 Tax=Pseudoneurospora amorphoporcata TaxID=241081 RepID=A0AAN6NZG3_9PEZI|nr:Per1-like-domain-containing protein [Pseudoneurospora amorphoporcata]